MKVPAYQQASVLVEGWWKASMKGPYRAFMVYRLCFVSLTWFFKVSLLAKTRITLAKMKTWNVLFFLELWNGWWAKQCICNLMCFIKRKKRSGSVGGFSSVHSARERDSFSALVLLLSVVLVKINLSHVLFRITSRLENVFMVLNIKVPLDFMTIWCILSVRIHTQIRQNNIWTRIKDNHVACVLLFIFTHFQLRREV